MKTLLITSTVILFFACASAYQGYNHSKSAEALRFLDNRGTPRSLIYGQTMKAPFRDVLGSATKSTSNAYNDSPQVATFSDGTFIICYDVVDPTQGNGGFYKVKCQKFDASASKVGAELDIGASITGD